MYNKEPWPLMLYFDGECPLCAREIKLLRRHNTDGRLLLTDISTEGFDASALGFTLEDMHASLHARFADGTWVKGLDATLWSWRASGLGIWAAPLAWRPLRPLLGMGYDLFCHIRPHLAWLPHPDGSRPCKDQSCDIPGSPNSPGDDHAAESKQKRADTGR